MSEQSPAGEFWAITTFFNPGRYRTRLTNYQRFREASRAQGLNLITVELVQDDSGPELEEGRDAERVLHRRSDVVLWHKERLLNLALTALPADCKYVCWIDADVIFDDARWIQKAIAALQTKVVIQPFKRVVRLPRDAQPTDFPTWKLGWWVRRGTRNGTYTPSLCSRLDTVFGRYNGTTGYAWCARRELLDTHGFYDKCIVGGADRELAFSFLLPMNGVPAEELRITYDVLRRDIAAWHDRVYADVNGRVGALDGVIYHLWHGESQNRGYASRHEILERHHFDPARDLVIDEGGCWTWREPDGALARDVRGYLQSRREDG